MTPQLFLRYQLTLLLAQYGNKKIIAELKKILKLSEKEMESLLISLDEIEQPRRARPNEKTNIQSNYLNESSNRAKLLKEINDSYTLKKFLPELKDVKHFLESNSSAIEKIRSRSDAQISVLKALSSLDDSELEFIVENMRSREKSSLGIISDEILKKG
ncbi:hypothetical protein H2Y56_14890 [Pectobacterium aroidearum]|uniref:Uncharacterized protein n=1 Tax=Pectobacterium aroidearum TaxID=1201031 RepID=A0ABR5ZFQ6_9GAMM|nr:MULTISPECIES: hypothetical protein [Pectobacterium]MBA5200590.1 hypothetical protein [Pectobacterium aroidearum]MBA5228972.1 hypothetical protein [Pectobacterium aroidearum]MBA5233382.1 hypothetical protein [Pectobacterium aroidearum]MBA5738606.1 hypothetical protein [Pectobacterium aroidearum]UXK00806.1 hypothetical protein N5056_02065 [Pectobacterium aroidearum]